VLLVLPLTGAERLTSLLDLQSGTSFRRLKLWEASVNMVRDHPLLGVGLDNFLYQHRSKYLLPEAWQEPDLSHPHNWLLDYWTRLGLLGVASLVWLQVVFFREGMRLYRGGRGELGGAEARMKEAGGRRQEQEAGGARGEPGGVEASDEQALVLGLMASMVAFLAHGLIDNSYFVVDLAFVFMLTVGLVQRKNRIAQN
jgi:O-antigen ligase